jgi:hypothetical protein
MLGGDGMGVKARCLWFKHAAGYGYEGCLHEVAADLDTAAEWCRRWEQQARIS